MNGQLIALLDHHAGRPNPANQGRPFSLPGVIASVMMAILILIGFG